MLKKPSKQTKQNIYANAHVFTLQVHLQWFILIYIVHLQWFILINVIFVKRNIY